MTSVVVPPILTSPRQLEMLTVVVQLPLASASACLLIDPVPEIVKVTRAPASEVPEITSELPTVPPFTGVEMMVAGLICVSLFKEIGCD